MKKYLQQIQVIALVAIAAFLYGCGGSQSLTPYQKAEKTALESVKAGRFDSGRMWTFDDPPVEYFNQEYGFKADQQWLDDVRMSALKFATYCSASFVSGDGLVMTNHHCARESAAGVSQGDEHIMDKGFVAYKYEDERKVKDLFVEQLIEIKDVSTDIFTAMDQAQTDTGKIASRDRKIAELERQAADDAKNIRGDVVTLYNGGKYSLYRFKQYKDVRLVFVPETQLGFYGGDDDNFTYPRYALDCSFFRVYDDDGKPLKTKNFYKWSKAGAKEGEAVFVVGNPGSTGRLSTVAQLEFNRDYQFPWIEGLLRDRMDVLSQYMKMHPDKKEEMTNQYFSISNAQKSYKGQLDGLRNNVLMQKRLDFERNFQAAVNSKPALQSKYGHLWGQIASARERLRSVAADLFGLRVDVVASSEYLSKAFSVVRYALQMQKSESDREKRYQGTALELAKRNLKKIPHPDHDMEMLTMATKLNMMKRMLGVDDPIVKILNSQSEFGPQLFADSAKWVEFVDAAPASVMSSKDPMIQIALEAIPRLQKADKVQKEIQSGDEVNRVQLGRALYEVYGTTIPPDATFTLRISDGVVKGYPYNGTKAPAFTTFYGMYDRHFSFPTDDQWALPDKWLKPPADFDLSTPMNFVSTNDIIGGNSGSPLINKNKEIIGLAFDGNIESLPGEFIFAEELGNRTVSVHSLGMIKALKHIYKADRIVSELENGKMQ
jgi:hypothetical protein